MSGMVACGMLFCLASGDFDLSVASVIACAGVTTAVVINMTEACGWAYLPACCWAW
jgi:L-arabinose transport system permease protein